MPTDISGAVAGDERERERKAPHLVIALRNVNNHWGI
jgi:hypothetical protein